MQDAKGDGLFVDRNQDAIRRRFASTQLCAKPRGVRAA